MNRSEQMEEALKLCISEMCEQCREAAGAEAKKHKMPHHVVCVNECETLRIAKQAIALPRRQCDVGTAEEQARRFYAYYSIHNPPSYAACLAWAQMPYEKGDAE